jgi:hypothetical protein
MPWTVRWSSDAAYDRDRLLENRYQCDLKAQLDLYTESTGDSWDYFEEIYGIDNQISSEKYLYIRPKYSVLDIWISLGLFIVIDENMIYVTDLNLI